MLKKIIGVMLIPGALVGCVSMLPHYNFSDSEVEKSAEGMAIAMNCVENGLASGPVVYAYGYAVSQLYSVSVYNKELYEKTYQKKKVNNIYSTSAYNRHCSDIAVHFPRMTTNVFRQYVDITGDRKIVLAGMTQSLSSFGSNMSTYNQKPVQMPTGKVNFGLPERKVDNYLVDFGSGQRICTVTASGYVFCS